MRAEGTHWSSPNKWLCCKPRESRNDPEDGAKNPEGEEPQGITFQDSGAGGDCDICTMES